MSDQPQLSVPFVERDASVLRAATLKRTGLYESRRQRVAQLLAERDVHGMTWRELGAAMGLHHGQISGLLSSMHAAGDVFALRTLRDRCQPYVLCAWRGCFSDDECIDQPATTSASRNRRIAKRSREFADLFALFASEQIASGRITLNDDLLVAYARLVALLNGADHE